METKMTLEINKPLQGMAPTQMPSNIWHADMQLSFEASRIHNWGISWTHELSHWCTHAQHLDSLSPCRSQKYHSIFTCIKLTYNVSNYIHLFNLLFCINEKICIISRVRCIWIQSFISITKTNKSLQGMAPTPPLNEFPLNACICLLWWVVVVKTKNRI